ncbi:MAG: SPOR domain-containing protein [Proteobacteria bacterium]|nr:SPOR domain-containing protein [Pseudomonadota bacterium]
MASTAQRPPRNRTSRSPAPRHSGAGGTLLGIFIGLLLGLGLAAAVAWYLMGGRSAYQAQVTTNRDVREPARDAPKGAPDKAADAKTADKPRFDFYKILPGGDEPKSRTADATPAARKPADAPDKASVEKAAEKSAADKAAQAKTPAAAVAPATGAATPSPATATAPAKVATAEPGRAPRADDRYWLQVGSFTQAADAENLKAQLALMGLQAAVQTGILDDKTVRYRVRLGPYDNGDAIARVKAELTQHGIESTAIRY